MANTVRWPVGAVGLLIGISILAWSGSAMSDWQPELIAQRPWFALGICLACIVGAGIALAGAPITGFLTAVLFLGGIAQLWFTEPDWFSGVVYRPWSPTTFVMLALLCLEGGAAAIAVRRFIGVPALSRAAERVGLFRLALLLALLVFSSVSVWRYVESGNPVGYVAKLAVMGVLTATHLLALIAILASPDLPKLWAKWRLPASRALPMIFALSVTLAAIALSVLAFHRTGAVEDEAAYLFQARTFAAGLLVAPPLPPGVSSAFEYYLLDSTSTGWFAPTAPGWPAVLAVGVVAGVPWLVNPMLGGLALFLSHRFVERCTDRATANIVALLMATSPWFIGTSASLMTHALSQALIVGAWLSLLSARSRHQEEKRLAGGALALLAGVLLGWLFLTRALEGVLIGVLTGVWLVWTVRLDGWRLIGLFAVGCLLTGTLLLAYNSALTGDPLVMPLETYLNRVWEGGRNDFGFGPEMGPPAGSWGVLDLSVGHSPLEGLVITVSALPSLNMELLGWPVGSLILIYVYLLWGKWSRFPRAMAIVLATVVLIHFFYWFNAIFYVGPRYWYAASLPIFILSGLGIFAAIRQLDELGVRNSFERMISGVILLSVFAAMLFVPWRGVEKYSARTATTHAIENWAANPQLKNSVVFLDDDAFKRSVMLLDPLLRGDGPIFVRDQGQGANRQVMAAFPSRKAVVLKCARVRFDRGALDRICGK
jgi:hypothetical protein